MQLIQACIHRKIKIKISRCLFKNIMIITAKMITLLALVGQMTIKIRSNIVNPLKIYHLSSLRDNEFKFQDVFHRVSPQGLCRDLTKLWSKLDHLRSLPKQQYLIAINRRSLRIRELLHLLITMKQVLLMICITGDHLRVLQYTTLTVNLALKEEQGMQQVFLKDIKVITLSKLIWTQHLIIMSCLRITKSRQLLVIIDRHLRHLRQSKRRSTFATVSMNIYRWKPMLCLQITIRKNWNLKICHFSTAMQISSR